MSDLVSLVLVIVLSLLGMCILLWDVDPFWERRIKKLREENERTLERANYVKKDTPGKAVRKMKNILNHASFLVGEGKIVQDQYNIIEHCYKIGLFKSSKEMSDFLDEIVRANRKVDEESGDPFKDYYNSLVSENERRVLSV